MAGSDVFPYSQVDELFQVVVGNTPVALTLPTNTFRHVMIQVSDQPVRWRADGVNPNGAMGIKQPVDSTIDWMNPHIDYRGLVTKLRFVRDTTATGNATLEVAFFT